MCGSSKDIPLLCLSLFIWKRGLKELVLAFREVTRITPDMGKHSYPFIGKAWSLFWSSGTTVAPMGHHFLMRSEHVLGFVRASFVRQVGW